MALAIPFNDTNAREPARAFAHRHEVIEQLESSDKDVRIVTDKVAPLRAVSPDVVAHFHQLEILGIPVGADHPTRVEVVRRVLEVAFARREHPKLARRRGLRAAQLAGYGAREIDADVFLGTCGAQSDVEAVVEFLVEDRVAAVTATEFATRLTTRPCTKFAFRLAARTGTEFPPRLAPRTATGFALRLAPRTAAQLAARPTARPTARNTTQLAARTAAQRVRLDPPRQKRFRIVQNIKQRPVVGGPRETRRNPGNFHRQRFTAPEVLDSQRELPTPDRVFDIGQQGLVRADLPVADPIEVVSFGEFIDIEHDLFGRVHAAFAARVDRVLLTFLEARVVPVILALVRYGAVVLLDSADDFLVQGGFRIGQRRHHRIGIVVLRLQVREHVGVGAFIVAQPIVFVLARRSMGRRHFMRALLRGGRCHRYRVGIQRQRSPGGWVGGVDRCISCSPVTLPQAASKTKIKARSLRRRYMHAKLLRELPLF